MDNAGIAKISTKQIVIRNIREKWNNSQMPEVETMS